MAKVKVLSHAEIVDWAAGLFEAWGYTKEAKDIRQGLPPRVDQVVLVLMCDPGPLEVDLDASKHPRPWRIEHDWSWEVVDARGDAIAKFPDFEKAAAFLAQHCDDFDCPICGCPECRLGDKCTLDGGCSLCSGEYCLQHFHEGCDCDAIDRHRSLTTSGS